MSKGLESLKNFVENNEKGTYSIRDKKDLNIIESELQRLKAIDNSKPSEFKIVNYKGQYYLQINVNDDEATRIQLPLLEDEIKDVQLAIDKFKQIDNTNPSEALEFLKQQAIAFERSELAIKVANGNYDSIKQALLKAQEQEKVLKVIFEKNVNIASLKAYDLEEYNMVYENKLTQEEFDLLKRYCNG